MPLKSYIQSKKDVKTGVKCPQEKEELIRSLILKEALDKLGCTYENFTEANKISKSKLKSKSNSPQKESDDIFSKIDELDDTDQLADTKPLVVIDAQNIAMKHGRDKLFSVKGIQIAVNYWSKNGHRVVGFLPEYLFDYQEVASNKKLKEMGLKEVKP
jgi:hypothetical protein